MPRLLSLCVAVSLATFLSAQNETPAPKPATPPDAPTKEPEAGKAEPTAKELLAQYSPSEGTVAVGERAEIKLGTGWLWLDGSHGRAFLTDQGNRVGPSTLGVALPPDFLTSHAFAVYSYSDEGHVDDQEQPDHDALLKDMQASTKEESALRKKDGMQGVELLGWAEPPHYDQAQRKMYWAEQLQFEGQSNVTLNYNVRILGRAGFLVVNGVGGIDQLALVAAHCKDLLAATEFKEGQRYADFDPKYDKLAAYGIGGLIAGKLAMKVGLLALLKGAIKPILIGVVLLGGFVWKLLTGRKRDEAAKA